MATDNCLHDDELRGLLGTMSHDLRNPLAAIVTNVEFARKLLKQADANPDLAEAMEDTAAACDVLRQLIANLDVLAKGAHATGSLRETAIASVVQEVLNRCQTRAAQTGVEVAGTLADTHCTAIMDRALLGLTIENLVANALQHAPSGSTVEVQLRHDGECACIDVWDSGGSIPDEMRQLAVSAAGQTRQGRTPGTRYGRGLALLTARLAAEANGGQLILGGDGERNCFTLQVPAVPT